MFFFNLSSEWNSDILLGIFQTFQNYFNKGFCKVIKNETILITIVRIFIDSFLNYYFDELIYTIRTIFKKEVVSFTVYKYRFKYIKCFDHEEELRKEKEKLDKNKNKDKKLEFDENDATQVKNLSANKTDWNKDKNEKKYKMVLKVLKDEDKKNFNPDLFKEKLFKDFKTFKEFFDCFTEDSKEPFTKAFPCILGSNFVGTYLSKFEAALEIINVSKTRLLDFIKTTYKESFHGTEGKNIMEILLLTRKDAKEYIDTNEKKLAIDIYDARIG